MLRLIVNQRLARISTAALVSVCVSACSDHKPLAPSEEPSAPRVLVQVVPVAAKATVATEEIVGTVRSKLRASVEAKISARIENMLVAPGQAVKAGELLAQLDTREIQARLDQAVPVLRNAEIEAKRFKALVEQRAVSQSEYDAIEARFRVAQASVTEAETMLAHTRITAPFAGVITRKLADVGDLALPGRPLLEIDDPRLLRVEADVPESLIDRVQLGAKMRVSLASSTQSLEAVVSEMAPAADSSTRTFLVKLDLPGQAGLRAGQFARLAIPLGESRSLRVPASSVLQRGQMELVFVADADRARLRLVKTGRRMGTEVEIVSGLTAGDRVVTEGAKQLRDGQPIEVQP